MPVQNFRSRAFLYLRSVSTNVANTTVRDSLAMVNLLEIVALSLMGTDNESTSLSWRNLCLEVLTVRIVMSC